MKFLPKILKASIVATIGWFLYALSSLFKRDTNRYLFGVHTDSFSGNVKALLLDDTFARDARKIFIYKNKKVKHQVEYFLQKHNKKFEYYFYMSPHGLWHSLRSKYYIYSGYVSDINFWTSCGAVCFNVWHGTPLKKIERDVDTGYYALKNKYESILKYFFPHFYKKPDKMLVASEYEKRCFKTAFDIPHSVFIESFPPRLKTIASKRKSTKQDTILYVPTWRDDHSFSFSDHIDLDALNRLMIELGLIFMLKPHPSDTSEHIKGTYSNITIADKKIDIYTILPMAKIVVTDYSSMMFEALYCNIPCVLFCPDIDSYVKKNRNFYIDINLLPFFVTKTFPELLNVLKKPPTNYPQNQFSPYKNTSLRVHLET